MRGPDINYGPQVNGISTSWTRDVSGARLLLLLSLFFFFRTQEKRKDAEEEEGEESASRGRKEKRGKERQN